jgi:AcrR family transcriptional regulator
MQSSPTKPPALQPRSKETEHRILQTAVQILGQSGAEGLTTVNVSEAAGVSVGTIYRRFGNKEQLLRSTQAEFLRTFQEHLDKRLANLTAAQAADPTSTISHATKSMCENFRDYAAPLKQLLLIGMQNPQIYSDGHRASVEGGRKFGAIILRLRSAIAHDDPDNAVDFTYRLTYAMCSHRITQGPLLESERSQTWTDLIKELSRANQAYLLAHPNRS